MTLSRYKAMIAVMLIILVCPVWVQADDEDKNRRAIRKLRVKIRALISRVEALETINAAQQTQIDAQAATITVLQTEQGAQNTNIANLQTENTSQGNSISTLQTDVANLAGAGDLMDIFAGVSRFTADHDNDPNTPEIPTIRFEGVNLQIVNGVGATASINGVGNLIIGYDEEKEIGERNIKTGSHNLVLGPLHTYSSYGSLVAGFENTVSGPHISISGGFRNTASGDFSSISGGLSNTASGIFSSISGGGGNTASGQSSSVSGGIFNTASGQSSSVSGGNNSSAPSTDSWAAGSLFEPN